MMEGSRLCTALHSSSVRHCGVGFSVWNGPITVCRCRVLGDGCLTVRPEGNQLSVPGV